ncbi:hypothetical protein H4R19_007278, partial [Coemansia spiralis]
TTEDNAGMRGWLETVAEVEVECIRKEMLHMGDDVYLDSWDYAIFDHEWYIFVHKNLQARMKRT